MDLTEVRQLAESLGIAKGNIYDAVVGQSRERGYRSRLLSTAVTGSGDEDPSVLAVKPARLPQPAGCIPEGLTDETCYFNRRLHPFSDRNTHLPLSREVTVTSGDTEEEGIELAKVLGMKDGIVGLRGRIHLGQDFLREGLLNPNDQNMIRDQSLRLERNAYW
jgi:hypothetical protein